MLIQCHLNIAKVHNPTIATQYFEFNLKYTGLKCWISGSIFSQKTEHLYFVYSG